MKLPKRSSEEISAKAYFTLGFAILCLATFISTVFQGSSYFHLLEMGNLDVFLRADRAPQTNRAAVVEVTDNEYETLLHGASPPTFEALSPVIHDIALSGPSIIVVDFDTGSWSLKERSEVYDAVKSVGQELNSGKSSQNVPIARAIVIWAVGGWEDDQGNLHLIKRIDWQEHECFGAPALPRDDDGVVRNYLPYIVFDGERIPNLAVIANDLYESHGGDCDAFHSPAKSSATEPRLINFRGGRDAFVHFTAEELHAWASQASWRRENVLQRKIVILGGTFREARDKFMTSTGYLDGVDILAHAIESQAKGQSIEPVGRFELIICDLLVGLFLITVTYFFDHSWSLLVSFVAIPVVALGMSYTLFHSLGYFASFVPVVFGVVIHEAIEHGIEHRRLRRENRSLRDRLASGKVDSRAKAGET